jgi:glycolate oxidase iron-sulfur subunit
VFFGDVNAATVAVLAAEGWEVHAPRQPRCCGALQLHTGDDGQARELARRTIAAFESYDVVVVNAAGCGSAMKDYGHLFRDDPAWGPRAEAFAAKVRDVSELLAEHEPVARRRPLDLSVAYHDAATSRTPRVSAPSRARCCAGSPASSCASPPSGRSAAARPASTTCSSPSRRASSAAARSRTSSRRARAWWPPPTPGCALQIAAHAADLGQELRVVHPMELLHASIEGRTP